MSAASFDALGTDRDLGSDAYRLEDFPGCESFHLPASEIDRYEGRLEFWDGVTETAWKVCERTSSRRGNWRRLPDSSRCCAARVSLLRLGGLGASGRDGPHAG